MDMVNKKYLGNEVVQEASGLGNITTHTSDSSIHASDSLQESDPCKTLISSFKVKNIVKQYIIMKAHNTNLSVNYFVISVQLHMSSNKFTTQEPQGTLRMEMLDNS